MSGRRRAGLWIAGILGVAVVAALAWGVIGRGRHAASPVVYNARTPLPAVVAGLRNGDARALLILFPRLAAHAGPAAKAATEAEAKEWIEVLQGTRTGFLRFGSKDRGFSSYARTSALMLVSKVLERFAVEEAPRSWSHALRPVHDLFASGLADPDLQTRVTALNEVGRFWSWFPGRTMMPVEEEMLINWKAALYAPVVRRLADREPQSRAAAVACLGLLPDDQAAAPALAYLEDRSDGAGIVRMQVLSSFAHRPALLTEDTILKRLQDPEPGIREAAEIVLKTRGLTPEQIELGRLIFDPKPEHRASVIPRLRDRTDIDPVVWLLQLSQDESETVRADAVAALAGRSTPEVLQRLGEMARSDPSTAVRQAAAKLVPAGPNTETATALPPPIPAPRHPGSAAVSSLPGAPESTVSLPPLPGSPSLNPRAN